MPRRFLAVLVLGTTGCPEYEHKTYRFDLAAGTAEVRFVDLRTTTDVSEVAAFGSLVEAYLVGSGVEEGHAGWKNVTKELVEEGDRLDGVVRFGFDAPGAAGIYKHDKKSPWIWCAEDRSEIVEKTNGKDISAVLPGCVAFDRKAKVLEIQTGVKDDDPTGEASLVAAWKRWKADGAPVDLTQWKPYAELSAPPPPPAPEPPPAP